MAPRVFATTGSQKFPFDRLISKLDSLAARGVIARNSFVQSGVSLVEPSYVVWSHFLGRDEFTRLMKESDLVVTHAGTGAIVGAVKQGKKVVAVPRHAEFGEHVDDHQVEIVRQFADMGLIEPCYDIKNLEEACHRALIGEYRPYKSNSKRFASDLEDYLDSLGERA